LIPFGITFIGQSITIIILVITELIHTADSIAVGPLACHTDFGPGRALSIVRATGTTQPVIGDPIAIVVLVVADLSGSPHGGAAHPVASQTHLSAGNAFAGIIPAGSG